MTTREKIELAPRVPYLHVDTPQRYCHLITRPTLKHVQLKTKGKSHPSGLASKLGTTLSMRTDFHDWVQALETELNRCRAVPTEAEVRTLLRNSVHVDLQGAVADACIVKGELAPSLVMWFDELVSYVYTSFKRAKEFLDVTKMIGKQEPWALRMDKLVDTLRNQEQQLYSAGFAMTVVFDFQMRGYMDQLGPFRTGLKATNDIFPLEHGDFLEYRGEVCYLAMENEQDHCARDGVNGHSIRRFGKYVSAWEEKQPPCQGCSVVFGKGKTAGYRCFWKQPQQARPGYLMYVCAMTIESRTILVLQDGYSHLTAFVLVDDEARLEELFLNTVRVVMGKLPQVLIYTDYKKWHEKTHEMFAKLCRKHQIIYHFMINPAQNNCDALYTALSRTLDPPEILTRDKFGPYNLRRFQDTINYHPSLICDVSPYERHFNTLPPVEYEKGSVQGHARARQFLYNHPGENRAKATTLFPALVLLSGIRPLKLSMYDNNYWQKSFPYPDEELFAELQASVNNCGVLLQDIKVGDMVLYSYIDVEKTKEALRKDPEAYVTKLTKPQSLFLEANFPSIAKDAGHAGHKVYKKGTNQPRPPFLAPMKVLAVTQSEGNSKRFKLQTTGPRKVIIKSVPHECLRRYESGIQLTFSDLRWPSDITV